MCRRLHVCQAPRRQSTYSCLPGQRISETRKSLGIQHSDETKAFLAECAVYNWQGGKAGEDFAAVLCPVGFIREYHFLYGEHVIMTAFGLRRKSFNLDFAHVEGKINIELDGPSHKSTPAEDAARDAILRDHGWRIIRIKHA